uniref:Core-2/I-Branching enzyme n=1 Tax=Caenorhabditis tropicalis TaxID=1561998 RepID=A0A1I7T4N9_9PELO
MFNGDRKALARGSLFEFDESRIKISECEDFRTVFGFFETARSEEEKEFPLAYGMLIHDNFIQLTLLLSAIYQPQNQFCLAVDGNSTKEFVEQVALLASCYPNIHYFITDKIKWCGYEILTSVFQCVDYLSRLPSDWKYFQYLSGVDAPLKSNLEMVRIFKAFNGSFNAEISPFEYYRLNRKLPWNSPLPLFKTSLSATFSRESANFMVSNEKVLSQIEFLRGTTCADESLWATIAGNPDKLAMPGGFNAAKWLRKHRGANSDYYVSRYQQYVNRPPAKCQGMEGFRKTGITGEPLEIERSVREQNCSA